MIIQENKRAFFKVIENPITFLGRCILYINLFYTNRDLMRGFFSFKKILEPIGAQIISSYWCVVSEMIFDLLNSLCRQHAEKPSKPDNDSLAQ